MLGNLHGVDLDYENLQIILKHLKFSNLRTFITKSFMLYLLIYEGLGNDLYTGGELRVLALQ